MAFAGHERSLGLAILNFESDLLPANPTQTWSKGQPHRIVTEAERHGHPHPTVRRADPHMEILDVLARQATSVEVGCIDCLYMTSLQDLSFPVQSRSRYPGAARTPDANGVPTAIDAGQVE